MRKATAYCDICNKLVGDENNEKDYHLYLFEKRRMDAAGSMDNEYVSKDLCPEHLIGFIKYLATTNINVVEILDNYILATTVQED